MDKVRSALGASGLDEGAETAKWEGQCALTRTQRMYGFAACVVAGIFISLMSFLFWTKPRTFALLYTLGNIISVASTGFLVGFVRQLRWAFARKRVVATIVFVLAMIGTLVAALAVRSVALAVVMIIIQFMALVWYSLSYIPFGQQMLTGLLGKCVRA